MKKLQPLHKPKYRELRDLGRTGFSDNLEPVESLDLSKVKSVDDLVRGMKKTAFGGRSLGEAADVLKQWRGTKIVLWSGLLPEQ